MAELRVLLLEDNPDDAELAQLELRRAGLEPRCTRVDTERAFVAALNSRWDLILADNNLPDFDGMKALEIVMSMGLDVPFIIVSGSIGEELAVAAMRSGAADYVLKDRLARLGQAAIRAVEQRRDRAERARAERLRTGIEMAGDLATSLDGQEVVDRVLRWLRTAVEADAGLLLLSQADGKLVVRRLLGGEGLEIAPGAVVPARGSLSRALERNAIARGRELGFRHSVALPLLVGDDVRVVMLLGRRGDAPFTDTEIETLDLIGNVAQLALRNAQLFMAAESASRAKSEFLNLAAHELRTPLSVISGYASMLSDGSFGDPGPKWADTIEIVRQKAAELGSLVDSLLTAARLEAQSFELNLGHADLNQLARDALRRATPRGKLLQASILLELASREVVVDADEVQAGRILDNLIDNALTYAGPSPWVRITVSPEGSVAVEDAGPGIPPEEGDRVFERFHRIKHRGGEAPPGTGLGLYIARQLARHQGGDLVLEPSRLGHGARFVLRLQAAAAGRRAPRVRSKPRAKVS